jgi:hypothetical protein
MMAAPESATVIVTVRNCSEERHSPTTLAGQERQSRQMLRLNPVRPTI